MGIIILFKKQGETIVEWVGKGGITLEELGKCVNAREIQSVKNK